MVLTEHPLAGRVWAVGPEAFVEAQDVIADLRNAAFVLLGESHDNPDHHAVQLRLVDALGTAGTPRALAMEQFDAEHQAAIDQALGKPGVDADDIASAGKLDRVGWDWPLYRPLVEMALVRGMPIVAVNLSRPAARSVVRGGFAALGDWAEGLPLEETWSEERNRILGHLINDGHCGHAPEDILRGIVLAQRARDATMARAMARHARRGVIGIVGRGHARRDIGIPLYLAVLAADSVVRTVGLVEVVEGVTDTAAYASQEGAGGHDYLWFTARVDRPDPCAGLRLDRLNAPAAA